MDAETVAELLRRVRAHDDNAFNVLCDLYTPLIKASGTETGGTVHDRDSAEADARIALYRAALSYRPDTGVSFGLYAKICIRNDRVSTFRRNRSRYAEPVTDDGAEGRKDDVLTLLSDREDAERLYKEIAVSLSPYEKKVLTYSLDGKNIAEIAAETGKPRKSVENARHRALRKLKALLR